jgi:mono/diheme cytochrome c family protein
MRRIALQVSVASALLTAVALPSLAADAQFPPDLIEQGRYLAVAGDCSACHTAPSSKGEFAGGLPIDTPIGAVYSSNITPSPTYGIGRYTEAEFARAVREGIRADGAHLYPAMPYTAYTLMSDADVHALYAYFMQGVKPVEQESPRTSLPFPFDIRLSMAVWNGLFLADHRFEPDPLHDDEWNRGAYLATALEHCSTCHSARGLLMQELEDKAFTGAPLGAWYAPNLTSDRASGIGGWSRQDIADYLKTGRVIGKAGAAGPMSDAVTHSLSRLSDADLRAIAAFFSSLPGALDSGTTNGAAQSPAEQGGASDIEAALRGVTPAVTSDGAALFSGLCASCHSNTGAGSTDQVFPSLFHNSTVGAERPDNLIAVILYGVDRDAGGHRAFMPSFGRASFVQSLDDAEIANLATFVRATFGPGGNPVTASDVALSRAGGPKSRLPQIAQAAIAGGALITLFLFGWIGWRSVRRRSLAAAS